MNLTFYEKARTGNVEKKYLIKTVMVPQMMDWLLINSLPKVHHSIVHTNFQIKTRFWKILVEIDECAFNFLVWVK